MLRRLGPFIVATTLIALACAPGQDTSDTLRAGRSVYGDRCSTCHGKAGKGGVGPSLQNVLTTWPSCDDQQEWIALGSAAWQQVHGPTYGANDTPITKVMPGHADTLSAEQIASVAAFERVEYGGGDADSELAACGFTED